MSSWTSAFASPNMCSAIDLASSVLPTPVGPSNANVPIGRFGSFKSARDRRSALHKAVTASRWPITTRDNSSSIARSFCASPCSMRLSGIPVHLATTCMMSSSSTFTRFSSRVVFHALKNDSSFSLACFSLSRIAAAPSKSCSLIARSLRVLISSISTSSCFTSGGRVIAPMRAREPASSITSMALSGRNRPVM